jgi:AcrR family transcriptional regulator
MEVSSTSQVKTKTPSIADPPLRADAEKNRERILAAAEAVFLEHGASAPLEYVAKRAGVGIGTLYRRFPTREALLAATYSTHFVSFAEACRARDAKFDAIGALRAYLEDLVVHTNIYRGFAASLGTVLQTDTAGCHATRQEGKRLLTRAQKAGEIRQDVSFDDLVCVATATSLAVEKDGSPRARIAHLIGMFIHGIGKR